MDGAWQCAEVYVEKQPVTITNAESWHDNALFEQFCRDAKPFEDLQGLCMDDGGARCVSALFLPVDDYNASASLP